MVQFGLGVLSVLKVRVKHCFLQRSGMWSFRRQWGLPTTTNTCESFRMHQQMNVHHAHHSDIPTFQVNIQRQVAKVDLRIAELESGKCLIPNRTLLRNVDQYGSILTRLAGGNLVDIHFPDFPCAHEGGRRTWRFQGSAFSWRCSTLCG